MPSKGRGGEFERKQKRLLHWLERSKNASFLSELREGYNEPCDKTSLGFRSRVLREIDINAACNELGFDSSSSADRDILLGILANILFKTYNALEKPGKVGRPKEWTPHKENKLLDAIQKLCEAEHLVPSDAEIARRLKESDFGKKLRLPDSARLTAKISELRKRLQ
jgi:hypothetical protein